MGPSTAVSWRDRLSSSLPRPGSRRARRDIRGLASRRQLRRVERELRLAHRAAHVELSLETAGLARALAERGAVLARVGPAGAQGEIAAVLELVFEDGTVVCGHSLWASVAHVLRSLPSGAVRLVHARHRRHRLHLHFELPMGRVVVPLHHAAAWA